MHLKKHTDESNRPLLDPFEHGWMRDTVDKILTPVMLTTRVPLAPSSAGATAVMNVLAVRLTLLCQNIYNYCTIAISVNEQC